MIIFLRWPIVSVDPSFLMYFIPLLLLLVIDPHNETICAHSAHLLDLSGTTCPLMQPNA